MSYRPWQQGYPFFRQDLKYDQILMLQIRSCQQAFNAGDPGMIGASVTNLMNMMTPDICDEIYRDDMYSLELKWEEEYKERMKEYDEKIKEMNCPDVYPKPNRTPGIDIYQEKYIIVLACLQRHGLLLKQRKHGSL